MTLRRHRGATAPRPGAPRRRPASGARRPACRRRASGAILAMLVAAGVDLRPVGDAGLRLRAGSRSPGVVTDPRGCDPGEGRRGARGRTSSALATEPIVDRLRDLPVGRRRRRLGRPAGHAPRRRPERRPIMLWSVDGHRFAVDDGRLRSSPTSARPHRRRSRALAIVTDERAAPPPRSRSARSLDPVDLDGGAPARLADARPGRQPAPCRCGSSSRTSAASRSRAARKAGSRSSANTGGASGRRR